MVVFKVSSMFKLKLCVKPLYVAPKQIIAEQNENINSRCSVLFLFQNEIIQNCDKVIKIASCVIFNNYLTNKVLSFLTANLIKIAPPPKVNSEPLRRSNVLFSIV